MGDAKGSPRLADEGDDDAMTVWLFLISLDTFSN
jgi:hypothetical protein